MFLKFSPSPTPGRVDVLQFREDTKTSTLLAEINHGAEGLELVSDTPLPLEVLVAASIYMEHMAA